MQLQNKNFDSNPFSSIRSGVSAIIYGLRYAADERTLFLNECLLLREVRKSRLRAATSVFDPKRTWLRRPNYAALGGKAVAAQGS